MLDFRVKKAAWCFTTDNVICFIKDFLGGGVESQEDVFRAERDADFDPAHVSGSDGEYREESVEEVNELSTCKGRGCCFNLLGPRPAAALLLQNPMRREVTVSNDPGIQLKKIYNKHQTNV